jgi:hypothetical protein
MCLYYPASLLALFSQYSPSTFAYSYPRAYCLSNTDSYSNIHLFER